MIIERAFDGFAFAQFAEQLKFLLRQRRGNFFNGIEPPERADAMGRAARRRAEGFSWGRMVDRYEALYRELGTTRERG